MNDLDAIIIGNTLAELLCAALLCEAGRRVLLVRDPEQAFNIGYFPDSAAGFPDCEYSFDRKNGIFARLLGELAIKDGEVFESGAAGLHFILDGEELACDFTWEDFRACLIDRFPAEKKELEQYFLIIEKLNEEWMELVTAKAMPPLKKIWNMARYSNFKYVDYVETRFQDGRLKRILKQEIVNPEVSMAVMAGYLVQIFEGRPLRNGYPALKRKLESQITGESGILPAKTASVEYGYDAERRRFQVYYEKERFESDFLVMTRDRNHIFPEQKKGKAEGTQIYINADWKGPLKGQTACKFSNPEGMGGICYRGTISMAEGKMQARIFCGRGDRDACGRIARQLLKDIKKAGGEIGNARLWYEEDIRERLGWAEGAIDGWSFSPGDFQDNPLTRRYAPEGFYPMEPWGRAFCTAAEITAKNILIDSRKQQ